MNPLKSYRFIAFFISFIFVINKEVHAQKPVISSFSPIKGEIGSIVIISGNNFSPVAANNIVYFGDVKANVISATSNSLSVTVPAGASFKPISVTVIGLTAYSLTPFIITFGGDYNEFSTTSFSTRVDSSWGFGINKIGTSDLDNDGDIDPIVVSSASNFISVLKNESLIGSISLNYSPSLNYLTGTSPNSIFCGDLDGDGKQDIVVANKGSDNLSVFKNNSVPDSIRLASKIDISAQISPSTVSISDIDNDGKPDIVCTNTGSNNISIFRNTTNGGNLSFNERLDFSTGKKPDGLIITDIDADGVKEIVIANSNDSFISIFRNTSTPGSIILSNRIDIVSNPFNMLAEGDFDGDGKTDIAAITGLSALSILRNISSSGNILFAPPQQINTGFGLPGLLTISDIDGDGKPDIAVNNINYSTVTVVKNLSQTGNISFSPFKSFFTATQPFAILITDINNDTRPDIILTSAINTALSIFKNLVNKPFISSLTPTTGGNGTLVTIKGNNFNTTTQVNFGGAPATSFTVISSTTITAVVDTGSAGEVTVITAYGTAKSSGFNFSNIPTIKSFTPTKGGSGTIVTITGTNFNNVSAVTFGNVPVTSFTIVSPTIITATVGALTQGNFDVSVTNVAGTATLGNFYTGVTINSFVPTSGPVGTIVTINGTNFSANPSDNIVYFGSVRAAVLTATSTSLSVQLPLGSTYQPITVTVNKLTAYSEKPFIITFSGTGNEFTPASFGGRVDTSAGNFPIYVSLSDLNNDGKSDVVTSNFASGSISVNKNTSTNGNVSFQRKVDYISGNPFVWSTSTGDLDGDGKIDVIAITSNSTVDLNRFFSFFKNVSTPDSIILTKTEYPIGITNSAPRYSEIADFDQDGKPDVAFLSFSGVALIRNTSTTAAISFAPKIDLPFNVSSESQIAITDVDGDGKKDLIVVGSGDNVYVVRNISKPGRIEFDGKVSVATGFGPRAVSLSDFDNDGKPDMVVLNAGNNSMFVYKNKSSAGVIDFDSRINYQLAVVPNNLALGDLDGDGRVDISFVTTQDKFVYVLKNKSSGAVISFEDKIQYDAPYTPGHIFIADMNNDGKMDLVANNASDANNFSVFINKCQDNGLTAPLITVSGPTEFCEGENVTLKTKSINNASYQWYKNGLAISFASDSVYTAILAGNYLVQVTVNSLTTSSAPLLVVLKPNPSSPILTISGSGSICKGMATTLQSSVKVGIQWYNDNILMNGITDSIYRVHVTGKYKVIATSNGCSSQFSNEIIITINQVPNPSITASATSFCSGDSITLNTTNVNGNSYQWTVNGEQIPGVKISQLISKTGGIFYVSETGANGCSAVSKTLTIIQIPYPAKPTITLVNTSLRSNALSNNQWFKDGVAIAGANMQVFTPTGNGNYSVQITQSGCKSVMSAIYPFVVTGVFVIDNTHFIKLNPNPTFGQIVLEFNLNGTYELDVDLIDLSGKIIRRWKDQKNQRTLYLHDFPKGLYLAKILSRNGKVNLTFKVVKL